MDRKHRIGMMTLFCAALLLPLLLGQSSPGGCGAAVTVPDNQDTGPDETLDETIDNTEPDSDGDGFSDDNEVNYIPRTDPNDAMDNPNNVRDTDADGCSDYDEINYAGFCDNDPYTGFCVTTFYNEEYNFGFDLPPNAVLGDTFYDQGFIIFASGWPFLFNGREMGVFVFIGEEPPSSLADWVATGIVTAESLGSTVVEVFPITLSDGTPAYFISSIGADGVAKYRVDVIANGYVYRLETFYPESVPTDAAHAYMISILDSFCVD